MPRESCEDDETTLLAVGNRSVHLGKSATSRIWVRAVSQKIFQTRRPTFAADEGALNFPCDRSKFPFSVSLARLESPSLPEATCPPKSKFE